MNEWVGGWMDVLEGLYISSGLGTPWSRRDPAPDKRKKMGA